MSELGRIAVDAAKAAVRAKVIAVVAPVMVVVLAIGAVVGLLALLISTLGGSSPQPESSSACGAPGLSPDASVDVAGLDVAGFSGEQLENAAEILLAGESLGISQYGQTIGVMTAIGESTLSNIDYGD